MPARNPANGKKGSDYRLLLRRYFRRRRLLVVAVIVCLALLRACAGRGGGVSLSTSSSAEDDFSRYHNRTFTCVKVVDGDTVDVEIYDLKSKKRYTRLRLWGIDTAELAREGRAAKYYSGEASEFARKLMQGRRLRLELIRGNTRGYYGRLLAYVYLPDGRMYNRQAIKLGYAYAEARFKHSLREEFLAVERQARDELAGLWADVRPDQLPRYYSRKKLRQFWSQRRAKLATDVAGDAQR